MASLFTEDEIRAFGGRRGMVSILREVDTDEGVIGPGGAAAHPSADIVLAVIQSIGPLAVGGNPFTIERIMKRVDIIGTRHHVEATSPAIAAVEMACWDIVGKLSGQPLANLVGGEVRDEVEFFCCLSHQPASDVAADAAKGCAEGFRTFCLTVGSGEPSQDIERVGAIRSATGPDAKIRVDANEASWTRDDQLELIEAGAADVVSVDNRMDRGPATTCAEPRDLPMTADPPRRVARITSTPYARCRQSYEGRGICHVRHGASPRARPGPPAIRGSRGRRCLTWPPRRRASHPVPRR
ncbi:mandelate racemase/muconate lactonizing enzyme family protein [Kocuria sp. M4R2S49]|uniref:mandelate racemase/muconate lactonizing enzyme family protein n=1 Tax=Kocuria rhizosphaericola TaxID=3376284 RepID=UPI0037B5CE8F